MSANETSPHSSTAQVVAGFICHNFDITGHLFQITETTFNQAFLELLNFLDKDNVEVTYNLNFKGLLEDQETIVLNDRVSIVKASYELARRFSI